jgi:hypothetical protein
MSTLWTPPRYRSTGYFDESEDATTLCLAGLFAPDHHWYPFESAWRSRLDEYGMAEFHCADCEHGDGFFELWMKPSERTAVEQRFIDIIVNNRSPSPVGYLAVIDVPAFRKAVAGKPQVPRRERQPWMFAFRQVLDRMVEAQKMMNGRFAVDERVDLVFDEKDESAGRVKELLKSVASDPKFPIGTVSFENSLDRVGLQAADLLAFEARRVLTDSIIGGKQVRPQWSRLMRATTFLDSPRFFAHYWDADTLEFAEISSGPLRSEHNAEQ